MTDAQDLYAILGVPANASLEDIRRAYRNAARRLHPDVNPTPGAASQFRDIAEAYTVLGDEGKKKKYDQHYQGDPIKDYFSLRVTCSKKVLPILDEPQVVYLLLELLPDKNRTVEQNVSRLNLTLVLDHSTSMKEEKRLDRTKSAAFQIIDQLTPEDYLSVVAFADRADVLVQAAKLTDKTAFKNLIMGMQPNGSTEILQGLQAGLKENQKNASPKYVNHIILLTDGRTFGDEAQCLELADYALHAGIGISAMGIGEEWNDAFLDSLAGRTGGSSEYITSPNSVVKFLNDRVKSLGKSFAERTSLSLAPDPDIKVESAFRLAPNPQPLTTTRDPIPLGQVQGMITTSVILQIQVPPSQAPGPRSLIRLEVTSDILSEQILGHKMIAEVSVEFGQNPAAEDPPLLILDALGKLTLYRMQEKANDALKRGDVREATRRLETLATRLLSAGEDELAHHAMEEAVRVSQTNMLSEEGHKALKYGTRLLLAPPKGTDPLASEGAGTNVLPREATP